MCVCVSEWVSEHPLSLSLSIYLFQCVTNKLFGLWENKTRRDETRQDGTKWQSTIWFLMQIGSQYIIDDTDDYSVVIVRSQSFKQPVFRAPLSPRLAAITGDFSGEFFPPRVPNYRHAWRGVEISAATIQSLLAHLHALTMCCTTLSDRQVVAKTKVTLLEIQRFVVTYCWRNAT